MRCTPVGKHPTSLPVVGFTISVESGVASGPQEGLVARYCSFPHGVIRGTTSLWEINEYPAYSRALGGIFGSHMPEKSGSPQAVFGTCQALLEVSDFAAADFPFAAPKFPEFCESSA